MNNRLNDTNANYRAALSNCGTLKRVQQIAQGPAHASPAQNEMIERVRAAIVAAMKAHGEVVHVRDDPRYPWTRLDGDFYLAAIARAAIEAMREPTKKMIRRGADQCDGSEFAAEDTWETMIDTALAEPTAPR